MLVNTLPRWFFIFVVSTLFLSAVISKIRSLLCTLSGQVSPAALVPYFALSVPYSIGLFYICFLPSPFTNGLCAIAVTIALFISFHSQPTECGW